MVCEGERMRVWPSIIVLGIVTVLLTSLLNSHSYAQSSSTHLQVPSYRLRAAIVGAGGSLTSNTTYSMVGILGQQTSVGPTVNLYGGHIGGFLAMVSPPSLITDTGDFVVFRNALHGNSPNPFNPFTTIYFTLSTTQTIRLDVFDLRGMLVRQLESGERVAGTHNVRWDGSDANGQSVASGVYLYRLKTEQGSFVRRMLLLK